MGDTRCTGWVDTIQIQTYIDGAFKNKPSKSLKIIWSEYFNIEAPRLFPLMLVHSPDADLDQPARPAVFHDAGKRAGVRFRIAFKIFVEVRVGIEVEYGKRAKAIRCGVNQRRGNRMIATECDDLEASPMEPASGFKNVNAHGSSAW